MGDVPCSDDFNGVNCGSACCRGRTDKCFWDGPGNTCIDLSALDCTTLKKPVCEELTKCNWDGGCTEAA